MIIIIPLPGQRQTTPKTPTYRLFLFGYSTEIQPTFRYSVPFRWSAFQKVLQVFWVHCGVAFLPPTSYILRAKNSAVKTSMFHYAANIGLQLCPSICGLLCNLRLHQHQSTRSPKRRDTHTHKHTNKKDSANIFFLCLRVSSFRVKTHKQKEITQTRDEIKTHTHSFWTGEAKTKTRKQRSKRINKLNFTYTEHLDTKPILITQNTMNEKKQQQKIKYTGRNTLDIHNTFSLIRSFGSNLFLSLILLLVGEYFLFYTGYEQGHSHLLLSCRSG